MGNRTRARKGRDCEMKKLRGWPWLLLLGAAVIAYLLGVRRESSEAAFIMAVLVMVIGAYFVTTERRRP
jgi:hypothetical protein